MSIVPELSGRDRQGRARVVPDELPAERSVVVLAFAARHQPDVDAWLASLPDAPIVAAQVDGQADRVLAAVGLPGPERVVACVCDRTGAVRAVARGRPTLASAARLVAAYSPTVRRFASA